MMETKKLEIPPHTKWGIRVTTIIILLISVMIIKNCMGSFIYGVATEQEQQKQYYEIGYSHGIQKARGNKIPAEPETDNPLLRKMYRKGFRDGWDSVHASPEGHTSSGQPRTEK